MRLRVLLVASATFFPMLTLVPLGSLWLWQNGYLFYWVVGALCFTFVMYGLAARAIRPSRAAGSQTGAIIPGLGEDPREAAARREIDLLADTVEPSEIQSRNDIAQLAARTIEVVARQMHPKDRTPVWNFTIPEVLLLTERVSARLRPMFVDGVPLGGTVTVGQALRLYEFRSVVGTAEKLYDIWRVLRVLNPIAAVTQEARERITKQIVTSVRDDFTRRLVRIYVLEVGGAAIDLYSGRLRDSTVKAPPAVVSSETAPPAEVPLSGLASGWNEAKKFGRAAAHLYGRRSK